MGVAKPEIDYDFRFIMELWGRRYQNYLLGRVETTYRHPFPAYILEFLEKCYKNGDMELLDYIAYLGLYRTKKFIPLYSKKDKDKIIEIIEKKYKVTLDYKQLDDYLKLSIRDLMLLMGMKLEITMDFI